jgi:hypothetical protein
MLLSRVQRLLDVYAANDRSRVFSMVDRDEFTAYGSDLAEVVQDTAGLKHLMDDDFALWRTAGFGTLTDVDVRMGSDLATAFFNVPFSVGAASPVTVRLSTTWRKISGSGF